MTTPSAAAAALAGQPSYLAYIRSSGAADAFDRNDAAAQEATLRQNLASQLTDVNLSYDRQNEQIGLGYARRGGAGSGLEVRDMARNEQDRGRAVSQATTSTEQTIAQIYANMQRRLADRAMGNADAALSLVGYSGG